jgi:6,7-dimethyl-8-ribityllumazine synthase
MKREYFETRNGFPACIHELKDGGYVLSVHEVWVPGAYESFAAAKLAAEKDDSLLIQLQDQVAPGCITEAMLLAAPCV